MLLKSEDEPILAVKVLLLLVPPSPPVNAFLVYAIPVSVAEDRKVKNAFAVVGDGDKNGLPPEHTPPAPPAEVTVSAPSAPPMPPDALAQ